MICHRVVEQLQPLQISLHAFISLSITFSLSVTPAPSLYIACHLIRSHGYRVLRLFLFRRCFIFIPLCMCAWRVSVCVVSSLDFECLTDSLNLCVWISHMHSHNCYLLCVLCLSRWLVCMCVCVCEFAQYLSFIHNNHEFTMYFFVVVFSSLLLLL